MKREYSDETAKVIDDEVENLITEAANRARAVIKINRDYMDKLKDSLIEKETVDAAEVKKLLDGARMPKAAALY